MELSSVIFDSRFAPTINATALIYAVTLVFGFLLLGYGKHYIIN